MFSFDRECIDKSWPVPVGAQLRGLIAYLISNGEFGPGARLPSVRDLSGRLGLASKTVHQVYQDLHQSGLVEMRRGLGAFVAGDAQPVPTRPIGNAILRSQIERLIDQASGVGIAPSQLLGMVSAQMQARRWRTGLRVVFVGIFEAPTHAYVEELRPFLAVEDRIELTTIEQLANDGGTRARFADADLALTFIHRQHDVRALLPDVQVIPLRFIPAEPTRRQLAGIEPRSRLAAITRFQDYIAMMRPSIRQFAPHVADIRVTFVDAPDMHDLVRASDVIVYATGADEVAALVAPNQIAFEYRHAPDRSEVERVLPPLLAELRRRRAITEDLPTIDPATNLADARSKADHEAAKQ